MKFFTFLLGIVLALSCLSLKGQSSDIPLKKTFQLPEIPSMLVNPEEKTKYLLSHYWDHFDFRYSTLITLPEVSEQAFVNYLQILGYVDQTDQTKSIKAMLGKAEAGSSSMFSYFTGLYEKYLYDPNSPIRNEELYIPVLDYVIHSTSLKEINKIRPRHQLEIARKNRPGHQATDFTYTLPSGKTGRLSGITALYTLLIFYNPDCHECKHTVEQLSSSPLINKLLKEKTLQILALYPDQDLTLWRNKLAEIPSTWITGYDADQKITHQNLYNLDAIPTLYLLDQNKKVILKDAPWQAIEAYLHL